MNELMPPAQCAHAGGISSFLLSLEVTEMILHHASKHQAAKLTAKIWGLGFLKHIPHSFIMFGRRCWIYKQCQIKFKITQESINVNKIITKIFSCTYNESEIVNDLGDVVVGAVDVDLFHCQFSTSIHITTQEHLTKRTDTQLTTSLPVTGT